MNEEMNLPTRDGAAGVLPRAYGRGSKAATQGLDVVPGHDSCGIGGVVDVAGRASHATVDDALKIVEKLEHRAGKDATGKVGDGVGVMLQVPHRLFADELAERGVELPPQRTYGVGMFFFPTSRIARKRRMKLFQLILEKEGFSLLAWREVPTNPGILGKPALDCMPAIWQCFVAGPEGSVTRDAGSEATLPAGGNLELDRRLYVLRREFEQSATDTYVVSLSSRTIVYKGMFLVGQLRQFYLDLDDPRCESSLALVHSRFSTNTEPSWQRAHPNRLILHNGEINTIRGNIDRMLAREETMHTEAFAHEDLERVLPVVDANGSDSAMLDNMLEFLLYAGMELPKAVAVAIPEPWRKNQAMPAAQRDMYHYYATMMEPWDGPAAVLFSDGDVVGAVLDRNGLRPLRYYETRDGRVVLSSEVGVLDIPEQDVVRKDRLHPGKMLVIDTAAGRIVEDAEMKGRFATSHPYGEWLDEQLVALASLPIPNKRVPHHGQELRDRLYQAFGYTWEEIRTTILPMAETGKEPTAAMGADTPLAVLSNHHRPLFDYFKQMFAQVTNPPIDAVREEVVTDTTVYVGSDGNLLEDAAANCHVLQVDNPILTSTDLLKIKNLDMPGLRAAEVSLLYYNNTPLERAIDKLFIECDKAYRDGANIIVLSDRGVDENHAAIPSLLAVSSLEQYLVRTKKRTAVSVVLESAEPRTVHHFATLLGYGARAVNPYLAQECIEEAVERGLLDKDPHAAIDDYNQAVLSGVVKVASKMGISTIQSYQSAQIFEAVGIAPDVVDTYFTNTISRVGGIGLAEIGEDVSWRHDLAFDPMGLQADDTVDSVGLHQLRSGARAESHMYDPATIMKLQQAVREGDEGLFREYTDLVDSDAHPHTLRSLLEISFDACEPVPLEEVEPAAEIARRFKTGAMSYGSISQEAHECLAVAMNRLGGKSNSGEGGEVPARLGTERNSAIKQVASGRFGVTSAYLVSAREIQIKMAQGAKPGEGGHLPGKKVWPWIARTRYSTPGVALISPPPHHDIYSIEDLAQLIYDLKNANKHADISVKLASEAGVGTIACGVAKAGAQTVLVAGYDGGTGAAPASSIHNTGLPWELGLAEAHQALQRAGLRGRVRLETDGKLMSGRDVAIACMLGAEEFGFATAPLVGLGCKMMRVCNLDTCPFGIATQNAELRARFTGKPEYVENFMLFIAGQVREILARLGLRSLDELVGRTDLLRERGGHAAERAGLVDVSGLLARMEDAPQHADPHDVYDFALGRTLDERRLMKVLDASAGPDGVRTLPVQKVSSTDRAVGTLLGAEITRRFGDDIEPGVFQLRFRGGAGQSFGAFIPKGLALELEGDANDYIGKGLSGGQIVVKPSRKATFDAAENVIIGNVAFYGATSGRAFVNGIAGERFCVRNSGAVAVVEGVGDHGCEYMTGGCVVVLGRTGRNFAAGMSGGVAYVLDSDHDLYKRLNKELVSSEPLTEEVDRERLRGLVEEHARLTGSARAAELLADFDARVGEFKKIVPRDYSAMLERIAACRARGLSEEQAELEAFREGAK